MASKTNQNDTSYVPSSSLNTRWNVFLSFRGGDTRKNFTGHLYTALDRAGIQTFMDDPELLRGEEISSGLLKAIQESKISIVVFSKNYASSTWCLDELSKILECKKTMGQLVLPVFYNINPSDVRYQFGSFSEAFEKHEKRFVDDMEKVDKWRAMLIEAADISGYHLDPNVYEADLIQKIVDRVLIEVNHIYLNVAKQPVGIDSRVKDITPFFTIGTDDVRRIGIYGMGGVGKTTIAKAVYNEHFHCFQGSCFLANVREASGQHDGLLRLQEQLITDVLKIKNFTVGNVDRGISLIRERLRSKKVLIVLDDLYSLRQLDSLAGQWNQFGSGSVIIITTRNECLLDQIVVQYRYKVKELDIDEALELFKRHAFGKTIPSDDFMELCNGIVGYAGGLPLALEVFGSNLLNQTMVGWKSFIEKLQQNPNNEIQEKLIISFDTLGDANLMDIFLDIACFFIGMDKDEVVTILETCYYFIENEINILVKRCLLTINDENELRMHDLLRDMCREIVRIKSLKDPAKHNRLRSCGDICKVLEKHKGIEAIEGIVLDNSYTGASGEVPLSTKTFERMHRLRFLQIDGVHLTGSFEHKFEELRWLRWRNCPLECLPYDFHPEKLVLLDVECSNFNTLWQSIMFLENLKILKLDYCEYLIETPEFTGLPCLEKLHLQGCNRLVKVHPSIGLLFRLVYLDLSCCINLRILPSSICNLRVLETLYLDFCSNIDGLPEELGNIESLRKLRAGKTKLKKIPDSIGYMKNLEILVLPSLGRNDRVLRSPTLYVTGFVPPSIPGLCSLRELDLRDCFLFDGDLPDNIGLLSSLEYLDLSENHFFSLPSSLGSLSSLRKLDVSVNHFYSLPSSLGSLSSLEELNLSYNDFYTLPFSLNQLPKLKFLCLRDCCKLRSLSELPPSLECLNAMYCASVVQLPNLSNLINLERLYLTSCYTLHEIQGLEKLSSVQEIHMDGCNNLAIKFEKRFFQLYSGFEKQIDMYLPTTEIPDWFSHQRKGSTISFVVPNNFLGMILWVVSCYSGRKVVVENRTNGTNWTHVQYSRSRHLHSAVSFIPKTFSLNSGDRIELSFADTGEAVEMCGVHLVCKPDSTEIDNYDRDVDVEGTSYYSERLLKVRRL